MSLPTDATDVTPARDGAVAPQAVDRTFAARLGPGLITGAADDDPSGIATYSQAGAQFRFSLVWTLFLTLPMMIGIQMLSARIGWVTQQGLATNIGKICPRWLTIGLVALLVVANTINIAADIAAMAESTHLIAGGYQPLYTLLFGAVSVVMQIRFSYERTVRLLKWLTLALFAYVAVVLAVRVPLHQAVMESIRPWAFFPAGVSATEYASIVVAVLGTTISPYLFFWQAAQEVEDSHRWPDAQELRHHAAFMAEHLSRIKQDTWFGMTFSNVIALCIVIATAVTLNAHGVTNIQTSAQAAEALRPVAGDFAFVVFALGIVGTGMLAIPVLAGSAAYAVSELFGWRAGLSSGFHEARGFYGIIIAATGIGTLRRRDGRRSDQGAGVERRRQRRHLRADHGRADDDRPVEAADGRLHDQPPASFLRLGRDGRDGGGGRVHAGHGVLTRRRGVDGACRAANGRHLGRHPFSRAAMTTAILRQQPLGFPWATIDPFLFCVHHDDRYPAADGRFGPNASLAGREIGSDFAGLDGWRMYHGATVPGFPGHPHRGFETVTIARRGLIDHADSLGAAARFGHGDVQWLTAGRGIVHSEMFPLLDTAGPNPVELFQIWLNLPASAKMADPHFTMLWSEDIPHRTFVDDDGRATDVAVIAGRFADATPSPPPPASWASRDDSDVAIWTIRMAPGARWTLPSAAGDGTRRSLYFFAGRSVAIDGESIASHAAIELRGHRDVAIVNGAEPAEFLLLQGRPIGEPVAQHGPFVMNSRDELRQAFADYQRTGFGGWPWPDDGPVHGADARRFAKGVDGVVETRALPTLVPAPDDARGAAVANASERRVMLE